MRTMKSAVFARWSRPAAWAAVMLLSMPVSRRAVAAPEAVGASARPSAGIGVVVDVDPGIEDAADLKQWVGDEVHEQLAGLSSEVKYAGELRLSVIGSLYDYEVAIGAVRDGESVGTPERMSCECSSEELLEMVGSKVPAVLERLVVKKRPPKRKPKPIERKELRAVEDPPQVMKDDKRRLGPRGTAGVTLMTLGTLGIAAGVPLIVLDEWPLEPRAAWAKYDVTPLRAAGVVTAGVGGGVLAMGILIYAIRDRRARTGPASIALFPEFCQSGHTLISFRGRF